MFDAPHVRGIYEGNQKQHISILNTESAELQCQMNANFKKLIEKRTRLHQTMSQEVEILARSVSKSVTIKRRYYDWPYVFA